MNDRERVLINIAVDTAGSVHDTMQRLSCGWPLRMRFGNPAPQFIPVEMAETIGMSLQPGDIVRCVTNPNHAWGISEFVEQLGHSEFMLREIGGEQLLKMGNESLDVLRFMPPSRLYTGAKHRIYEWASKKAFHEKYNPDADYGKRCGGVEFEENTLIIWCRAHIWCMEKRGENDGETLYAQPKKFTMEWSKKTKLKDIITAMKEQGFADDFEYTANQPTEGQAGFMKVTRADVENMLQSAGAELKHQDR